MKTALLFSHPSPACWGGTQGGVLRRGNVNSSPATQERNEMRSAPPRQSRVGVIKIFPIVEIELDFRPIRSIYVHVARHSGSGS